MTLLIEGREASRVVNDNDDKQMRCVCVAEACMSIGETI